MHFRSMLLAAALIVGSTSGSAEAQQAQESDVALSWTAARVFMLGHPDPLSPDRISIRERLPVVLYMHGCGNPNQENDLSWARYLFELGFIVIMPDRFARTNKAPSCWPDWNPAVHEMRREEVRYALERIKASAWADPANIFLMGFSEGADGVAGSGAVGARGAILSSWTCGFVREITLPAGLPILSILWDQRSRWRLWNRGEADCPKEFASRVGFQNLELHGKGHATYQESAARRAVVQFLLGQLRHEPTG